MNQHSGFELLRAFIDIRASLLPALAAAEKLGYLDIGNRLKDIDEEVRELFSSADAYWSSGTFPDDPTAELVR